MIAEDRVVRPSVANDAPAGRDRHRLLRLGFALAVFTIVWNLVEAAVASWAGIRAESVALLGFGIDALIETSSGVVVGWRLGMELRGLDAERAERIETRASRFAGGLLLMLAVYILVEAGRRLMGFGEAPQESIVGTILTAISLVVMPLLGWAKLRTARRLGSGALRADAMETITCAWLSLTTLVGLGLNAALGWWWADPLAGLVLVPLIVREGVEGLRGGCGCHDAGAGCGR